MEPRRQETRLVQLGFGPPGPLLLYSYFLNSFHCGHAQVLKNDEKEEASGHRTGISGYRTGSNRNKFAKVFFSQVAIPIPKTHVMLTLNIATHSDRITILVGPSQMSFQVPQDLLMMWSPPLGKMCRAGLMESQTRRILLPHIKTPTFEDFLIWMYTYEPRVDPKNLSSVLDLAIFAELYMI